MNESLLRRYIRTILLAEKTTSSPEGNKSDPLGAYVFASLRDDVPQPAEPDTESEKALANAYNKHYHGRPDALQGWIDDILDLKDDYPDFFDVPDRYTKAYRTLTVPEGVLANILGREITDEDKDGEIHVEDSGTQPGSFKGKNFFSWTIEPDIFYGLKKDWGSLFKTDWIKRKVGDQGFVIFIRADIGSNTFFNNPQKMKKTGLAGQFDYQMEVISVGEVSLDRVVYFYFDSDTDPKEEARRIKDSIGMLE